MLGYCANGEELTLHMFLVRGHSQEFTMTARWRGGDRMLFDGWGTHARTLCERFEFLGLEDLALQSFWVRGFKMLVTGCSDGFVGWGTMLRHCQLGPVSQNFGDPPNLGTPIPILWGSS